MGRWPAGPEGPRPSPPHSWGGGPQGRRGPGLLLPIHGEVARRAGGAPAFSSPFIGRWPAGPEGPRPSPPHSWGGGPKGRRGPGLLLPIHGEVARRAGGAPAFSSPFIGRWPAGPEGPRPSPPHSWGGGPQGRRGPGLLRPIHGEVARRAGGAPAFSSPFMGRWPEGPEGPRPSPPHSSGGGPKGRRGPGLLLPIHGEVARRAGGPRPSPPHSWGGG